MKLAILGYGRMGLEVERIAQSRGHCISAIFDVERGAPFSIESNLNGSQVIIDFTLQEAVFDNFRVAAHFGIPIVEGTTGWYDRINEIGEIDGLTVVYSPNFSIGVYKYFKLVEYAAKLMGPILDYDSYVHEWHHTGKVDSPSGTAKTLAKILVEQLPEKDHALFDSSHGKIDPKALHVTSTRVGRVPGTHEIGFDSPYDMIQLKHQAHGREGFTYGAVRAAEWIIGKEGVFTMDDFMEALI